MSGCLRTIVALLLGLTACLDAVAGGSAETTLLVVNADSPLSQRIANEYLQRRQIPETHVVRLSGVPSLGKLSIADFRKKVWGPIRDFIREHGLEAEIDLITYSGDFPYAVDFRADVKAHKLPDNRYRGNDASLTGLTYFAPRVEAHDPGYLGVNHYFRDFVVPTPAGSDHDAASGTFETPRGFRHRYVWSNSDLRFWEAKDALDQYYLSTVLAYTGERGNSLPEIVDYLQRSAASDGTRPEGTIYLMENGNVRSKTRQPLFPATVAELQRRGRKAEILGAGRGQNGIVPVGKGDVIGVVVGTQRFDWGKSKSRLLPGAIAESLTSYGGHFDHSGQTKLTEFLRHGAAGSSGAVQEPWSIAAKFPVPLLHASYADGCSLAEVFYQSVLTPYQLIVVGDPLARPFARFAEVGLETPDAASAWSGTVRLEPWVRPAEGTSVRAVELWVDGQYVASGAAGGPIEWDTRTVEDGSYDLRLVAVEDGVIETRSVYRTNVSVFNRDQRIGVEEVTRDVEYGRPIALAGRAEGAKRVEVRHGHQVLGSAGVTNGRWSAVVPSVAVGMGEVSVIARAVYPEGRAVRSAPVSIVVREPTLVAAVAGDGPVTEGLRAVVTEKSGESRELVVAQLGGVLNEIAKHKPARDGSGQAKGGGPVLSVTLTGLLKIEKAGFHQLAIASDGRMTMSVHGKVVADATLAAGGPEAFVALGLEAGWHPIEIDLRPAGKWPFVKVVMAGEQAPAVLRKEHLAYR